MKTPVALFIFNRPELTARVFDTIRQVKPPLLFLVADGPQSERNSEAKRCAAARVIVEKVDWDCIVYKNYSDTNLGCRQRVSSGLDWVFSHVEEAIILEDDCLPHETFFQFCEELLKHYRQDTRIMAISGDNFQRGQRRTSDSYYFSHYSHCWGWASWRRAWQHYHSSIDVWPRIRDENWLENIFHNPKAIKYWSKIFQAVYDGKIDSWAYQWNFTIWLQHGLVILPHTNLVSNIGFNFDASHTNEASDLAEIPTQAMDFPILHPKFTIRDRKADEWTQSNIFQPQILSVIQNKIKKIFRNT